MKLPPLGRALLPVIVLLASPGLGLCAQEAGAPKKKLVWDDNCAFTYNDEKKTPFEVKIEENVCNVLNVSARATFDNKHFEAQKVMIENAETRAKARLAAWQNDNTNILARTDPSKLKGLKGQVRKAKALGYRNDIIAVTTKWQDNEVVRGAQLRGKGDAFTRDVEARAAELTTSLSGAEIDKEVKAEAAALKAKSESLATDGKSATGRANAKITKASGSARETATTEVLAGKGYDAKERKHTGGRPGDALHLKQSAAAPAIRPAHATSYNRDKIPEMSMRARTPAEMSAAAAEPQPKPAEESNWNVRKRLDNFQTKIDDLGTSNLVKADKYGGQAERAMEKAADTCKSGSTWDCMKARTVGAKDWVTNRTAQAAYVVATVPVAMGSGLNTAARDPDSYERKVVKWGAIGVATIATGGAAATVAAGGVAAGTATTTAAVLTVGAKTAGGFLVAHGVTDGTLRMTSAENGKQFAVGAVEAGLSAAGPALGKGVGKLAEKVAPAAMEAIGSAAARGGSAAIVRVATALEGSAVGRLASGGLTAAAESSTKWAPQLVTKAVGEGGAQVIEKGIKEGTEWVVP